MQQPTDPVSNDHPPGIPIAVIGMAAVLPRAADLRDYWTHILRGTDCIEPVPDSRWRRESYFDPDPTTPDRIYADRGGFVPDLTLDPLLYGIAPTSLASIDSAQLYALVVARQALRDAGYAAGGGSGRALTSERSGIVLGVAGTAITLAHDMGRRSEIPKWIDVLRQAGVATAVIEAIGATMTACYPSWTEDSFPGSLANIVAGRIANRFGLGAASHTVDAACASSLAAVRLACQELRSGAADLMLSGGVDTDSSQGVYLCFSKTPALSKRGKVRPFDADADGTLISEGVAMVVLKRLDDAVADGDHIYGVIRGLGASTDAAGGAIYAPRSEGQLRAMRGAYADAGYAATSVGLIEAHATGTTVGDAVEIESLQALLADATEPVALGSVKAQIGHTKAAAGAASLIKTLLALHHRVLPGTAHVRQPHPRLRADGPLYLPRQARPWVKPDGSPRRASVSAFGFGGANVHLALEEYRAEGAPPAAAGHRRDMSILLVADDSAALARRCRELAEQWRRDPAFAPAWPELAPRREQPRLGLLASDAAQAIERLEQAAEALVKRGAEPAWSIEDSIHYRREGLEQGAKLVAVFSGQGTQTVGMGAQLSIDFPATRSIFAAFDAAARARGDTPISQLLYPIDADHPQQAQAQRQALTHTLHAQIAIGAYSMAVYTQLREYGLRPDLALGHSFGELTALWAAGSLDDSQYRHAVAARGAALTPPADLAEGGLLAIGADAARVRALLPRLPGIALANLNSPFQTVVGGTADALEAALPRLAEAGLHAVRLPVAAAFHTDHVGYALAPWRAALAALTLAPPRLPVLANLSAEPYPDDPKEIGQLLARQPFQPVRFQEQIEAAHAAGGRVFVEIGPRGILTRLVGEILGERPHIALATAPEPAADDGRQVQSAMLRLAVLGLPLRGEPALAQEASSGPLAIRISAANASTVKRANWPRMEPVVPPPVISQGAPAAPAISPSPVAASTDHSIQTSLAQTHRHFLDGQLALAQSLSQHAPSAEVLAQIERGQQQAMALHLEFLRGQQDLLGANAPALASEPAVFASPAIDTVATMFAVPAEQPATKAPAPSVAESGIESDRVEALLLRVVAEKTGFPQEMLQPSMRLEADLGVDSIKRVEILAAMRDALHLGESGEGADALRQAATLGQIAALFDQHTGDASAEPPTRPLASPAPAVGDEDNLVDIGTLLLRTVAEKTGFPVEMLDPHMQLEADLGIDSIKRVEILAAVRDTLGVSEADHGGDELRSAATVAQIATLLARHTVPLATAGTATASHDPPAEEASLRWRPLPVMAIPLAPPPPAMTRADAGPVLLLDDGGSLTQAVAAVLTEQGDIPLTLSLAGWTATASSIGQTPSIDQLAAALTGLVERHGTPRRIVLLQPSTGDQASRDRLMLAIPLLQALLPLAPRTLIGVGRMDGRLGLDGGGDSVGGGLAGLLKSLPREHPPIATRFVDLAPALANELAAERLLQELRDLDRQRPPVGAAAATIADYPLECGWNTVGRWTLSLGEPREEDAAETLAPLGKGELVLITGGARGITAACARALASEVPAHFVLIGRTAAADGDPAWARGVEDDATLKANALQHLRSAGEEVTPRQLEQACQAVRAGREVRDQLATLRELGAKASYLSLNLGDAAATAAALHALIAEHGPVSVLVHGAGALADKRIVAKTAADIAQVFAPKLDALLVLLEALRQTPPSRVLLFSSTAGYAGNAGQADYAMANEALSKLALRLGHRWPASRVVALNWGPWAGGMVGPALRKLFAERGVGLLPLAEGAAIFVAAARSRAVGGYQYVIGESLLADGATGTRIELEHAFSPLSDPLIDEHRINQRAVLPSAWVAGWLVESAARWRGRVVSSLEDYRVFKGVVFDTPEPYPLRLTLEVADAATVRAKVSDEQGRPRFAGTLRFDRPLRPWRLALPATPTTVGDASAYLAGPIQYGASFRGVKRVLRLDRVGALIECRIPDHVPDHGGGHGLGPLTYDIASHACLIWLMAYQGTACLPASMGRLCWRGDVPMPRHFFVEMSLRMLEGTRFNCDFILADVEGQVFATYEDFVATMVAADSPLWGQPARAPAEPAALDQELG